LTGFGAKKPLKQQAALSRMKGINWGMLYNDHKDKTLDPVALEKSCLTQDDDV
jgi:hypothetical protein